MAERKEQVIHLPKHLLDDCNGFSFDFGGSVIKVCYLAKSDWEKGTVQESEAPLRLTSFSRENLDECLKFVKENSFIRRTPNNNRPVIYTTGVGGHQSGKQIEEELGVTLENLTEQDLFVTSIRYLKEHLPLDKFCLPLNEKVAQASWKDADALTKILQGSKEKGHIKCALNPKAAETLRTKYDRAAAASAKKYILGIFGSAWGSLTIGGMGKEDEFSFSSFTTLGGRSFLGLGCLLTGAKDYGELMALAEKGNNLNLDLTENDSMGSTSETKDSDDVYSDWRSDAVRPLFLWGKAVGKNLSDFKREDIARTLLNTFCYYLAVTAYDALIQSETHHIFMAGSFCSHPLVQELILNEFEYRKWAYCGTFENRTGDYHMHFTKCGSHFGALGAILKGHDLMKTQANEK